MIRAAIVDTNVVVAGLLAGSGASPVVRMLDAMLAATFAFAVSAELLAEYRTVLLRTELRKLHQLTVAEVETLLIEIVRHAIVLSPVRSESLAPDPGDQHLWDLLASRDDLVLVTGDKRLLKDPQMRGRVVTPSEFVQAQWPN